MSRDLVIIALLVAAAIVPFVAVGADGATEYTQIDTDHPLTKDSKISNYQSDGKAVAELLYPNMKLTMGQSRDDVGLDEGITLWDNSNYLRIDYDEEKPRVVRIYIPQEYNRPYTSTLEPVQGDAPAEIEPVRDREYTSVKVELSGEQDTYIYELSETDGFAAGVTDGWVERASPDISDDENESTQPSDTEWQYVQSTNIGESYNITVDTTDEYRVQYLSTSRNGEEWTPVPDERTDGDPYFTNTRAGINDTVYVVSTDADTPQIRYKTSSGITGTADETAQQAGNIFSRMIEQAQDIIPF